MRRLAVAGLAVVVVAAGAAVAIAQSSDTPQITAKPTVTPNKAGTPKHPQPVKLDVKISFSTPPSGAQPIVQSIDVMFPKGSRYNGGKYPKCSEQTLSNVGLAGCPKGSIMGSGTGNANADTVVTHPQITVVNGGKHEVFFYTILNNPARVQAPVPGVITKLSGKWAYDLKITVPQVLQVVAGVPIELTFIDTKAGKGAWLETTGCGPGNKWPFSVSASYSTGTSSSFTASTPCRK